MRSHEERVAETKRRIAKMEREKRLRRNTVTMASAVAACLVLLIGASLAMPGIAARIQTGDYSGFETAASIFHGGAALGYIVIGLLAFLLGVCVTVLCFRLRQMNREDGQDRESEGMRMELIENLLQLLATFVGALLSGIRLPQKPQAGVFSAAVLLRLLCPRRALLDAVSAAVRYHAAGLLCVGVRLGGQRGLPAHFAGHAHQSG